MDREQVLKGLRALSMVLNEGDDLTITLSHGDGTVEETIPLGPVVREAMGMIESNGHESVPFGYVNPVRCRDCRRWKEKPGGLFSAKWCSFMGFYPGSDFFCKGGERRD